MAGKIRDIKYGQLPLKKRDGKGGDCYQVRVFPMEVEREFAEYPHAGLRTRRWMPVTEAARTVDDAKLGGLFLAFGESRG